MRVRCLLRQIRGERTIHDVAEASGVARGTLSYIERGRMFPADDQVDGLERAYGKPVTEWYGPGTLLELQKDEAA